MQTSARNKIENMPQKYINASFDNYEIYNNAQKEVVQSLRDFDQQKSLIFLGKTGTGKTHLSIALCKGFDKKKVRYVSSSDQYGNPLRYADVWVNIYSTYIKADYYFDSCNKSIKEYGSKEEYIKSLFKTDWLIVDDLGMNNFSEAKAENLYLLIDYADQNEKKFIITTNFTPEYFKKIDERIFSRLSELAKSYKFTWDDYRRKK